VTGSAPAPSRRRAGLLLLLALALLAFLLGPWFQDVGPFWQTVFDAGHTPLFGVLALVLLEFTRRFLPDETSAPWRPYAVAFGAAVALGLLSEALQYFGPRHADLIDAARDAAGAGSFLLVAATLDRRLVEKLVRHGWTRARLRGLAVVLFGVAIVPLLWLLAAHVERRSAFPALFGFQARWERQFVRIVRGRLDPAPPVPGRPPAGRVTFSAGKFSGLRLEPYPDWDGYDVLAIDLYSAEPRSVELRMRVDAPALDGLGPARFNARFDIAPGSNRLRVPLARVRAAPGGRQLDLRRVLGMALWRPEEESPYVLDVESIRLERDAG